MIRYECDNETAGCSNQIAELSTAVSAPWPGSGPDGGWENVYCASHDKRIKPFCQQAYSVYHKQAIMAKENYEVSLKSRGVYKVNFEFVPLQFYT